MVSGLIKSVTEGIRSLLPQKGKEGVWQPGLLVKLCISIVWGVILCLIIVLLGDVFLKPENGHLFALRMLGESFIGAFIIGVVGGSLGPAMLGLIPGIGKLVK